MHLPVSSEDTLHFLKYLCTQMLITDKQFLLLIDVPIQDHQFSHTLQKLLSMLQHRQQVFRHNL